MRTLSKWSSMATESAEATLRRFPATIIAACITTGLFWYLAGNNFGDLDTDNPLLRVALVLVYYVIMSVVVTLIAESWKLSQTWKLTLLLLVAIDSGIYFLLFPEDLDIGPAFHMMRWFVIVLAAFILTFVSGFMRSDADAKSFWVFFWELVSRLFVTVLFGVVLWGGVSLAVAAFDFLFGFDVDEVWYFRIWLLVVGVFGPWFYLTGFPQSFDTHPKDFPRFLKVLTMYIGTPIVTVYLLILYAYSAKILITGNWPEGEVVWLMLIFLLFGLAVALFSYPLQFIEKSTVFSKVQKIFYIAILPLMPVYFWAIKLRVEAYGWTDNRYIVTAFGVWIVVSSIVFLARKKDIRWIFGSFVIIAAISVLVPGIRMFDVGVRSQGARLIDFFEENGLIENGQIIASPERIQAEYDIQSIVSYLNARDALDDIVVDRMAEPFDTSKYDQWQLSDELLKSLNIETYYRYDQPRGENVYMLDLNFTPENQSYQIDGYTTMMRFYDWNRVKGEALLGQLSASEDGTVLSFGSGIVREIPIADILSQVAMASTDTGIGIGDTGTYEGDFEQGGSYKLIFEYANGQYDAGTGKWEYLSYSGWLLIK